MPIVIPAEPSFPTQSEQRVFEVLRAQLSERDLLICGQRISTADRDYEIDFVVVLHGLGAVVVEVKGDGIAAGPDGWTMRYRAGTERIDPIGQAYDNRYALITWLRQHSSLKNYSSWAHAIVMPFYAVADDFALPDARREQVAGSNDLWRLADFLADLLRDRSVVRPFGEADTERIRLALRGRSLPQRDLQASAAANDELVERRTEQQALILDVAAMLPRIHVRGGAGTGKTWLAVEHARRRAAAGDRVALMCYSRGLAAWMQRRVEQLPAGQRPAYVGTFHGLGAAWGAPIKGDDDSGYWESELPALMVEQARSKAPGELFDAIVIDEGQDFADDWWLAVLAAAAHEDSRLAVFTDEGQQVFSRFGRIPAGLVPLVLDKNLRNTRQVAATFQTLAPIRMALGDLDGPQVRLVECAAHDALDTADAEVDLLLDEWAPRDVALLATGSRHPEQRARQEEGQDEYWRSFWDDDQVFYGHVLGFKGLERNAIVLAVNDERDDPRATEKLYVGLSRAREQLVICADPAYIEKVGGREVLSSMRAGG
ncbi:nuclease-related domain-containing DEAD/DEAH box helicase [Cumulibacter manganitolerans]|uniref:nuclease-related domain-containing DEAD/DEAH box helicase n=1 Tax=Cumulibacter manganitolerans TaxID=1884992 RepID=UPI0012972B0A|nr:NERD domain-containing protein/DEAD/DEAH box helicase [Cumulibacter manganitolerans]